MALNADLGRAFRHLFGLLGRGRLIADLRSLRRLRGFKPQILFFCSVALDEQWIRTTVEQCRSQGLTVATVLASLDDPKPEEATKFDLVLSRLLLPFCGAEVVVTPSTGTPAWLLPRRRRRLVHMPHSLISLHMAYPAGAFDNFDVIFCCGEHHQREAAALARLAGSPLPRLPLVGYGKMDLLLHRSTLPGDPGAVADPARPFRVLLAPTWGEHNLLGAMGDELCRSLLEVGYKVLVQPHPMEFISRAEVIARLRSSFTDHPKFSLIDSTKGRTGVLECDLMISDYSGAALEFAFSRLSPVLFVETLPKVCNPGWKAIGLTPLELGVRTRIGEVVAPSVDAVVEGVRRLLAHREEWAATIAQVAREVVANMDGCAPAACQAIMALLPDSARARPRPE